VVSDPVFFCKQDHEPVAKVGEGACPTCGRAMTEIGWMEGDSDKQLSCPA